MLNFTDLPLEVLEFEVIPRVGVVYNYALYNTSKHTRKALAFKIKSDRCRNAQELAREGNLLSLLIRKTQPSRIILHNAASGGHEDVLNFAFFMGAVADQIAIENAIEGGFFHLADSFFSSVYSKVSCTAYRIAKTVRTGCRGGQKEAIQWGRMKFTEYLLSDRRGMVDKNAFIGACEGGALEIIESLLEKVNPYVFEDGFNAALNKGERRVVEWFYTTYPPEEYPNIYESIITNRIPSRDSILLGEAIEIVDKLGLLIIDTRYATKIIRSAICDGNFSLFQKVLARGFELTLEDAKRALTSPNHEIVMAAVLKLEVTDFATSEHSYHDYSLSSHLPIFALENEELLIVVFQRLARIGNYFTGRDMDDLLYRASCNQLSSLAKLLMALGANSNKALIGGCSVKDHHMINIALSQGATIYKRALAMASAVGDLHTVKKMIFQLKEDGRDLTQVYKNALVEAARMGRVKCVDYILTHANQKIRGEKTALFYAAFGGHNSVIELIMNRSSTDRAKLIEVCFFGASSGCQIPIVKKMLSLGAGGLDIALDRAVMGTSNFKKKKRIIEFLVSKGAKDLNTPLIGVCSRKWGSLAIIELLIDFGADDLDGAFSSVCKMRSELPPDRKSNYNPMDKQDKNDIYVTLIEYGAQSCTHCEKEVSNHEHFKCLLPHQ